jgi:tetratricopeptide (TPR) repeat protein
MSGHPVLFLSHSGADTQTAHDLKRRLLASPDAKAAGLEVWLDKDDLAPGRGWQEQIEYVITAGSTAFAVVLGTNGVINWVEREVRIALSCATGDKTYPFIPVFAAGATSSSLPPFARQFHGVRNPLDDEKELAKLLRAVLGDAAGEDRAGQQQPARLTGPPFVGLRAMTEADADRFFGREDELDALVETVRANRLVAIVADSGAGKSSLAQAGLIPRIRGGALEDTARAVPDDRAWQVVVMPPGSDPVEGLRKGVTEAAERLGRDGAARAALRQRIDPSRIDAGARAEWVYALQCDLPAAATETVLVVDQFEELLTQTPQEKRGPFIDWLMDVTGDAVAIPVRVVLTIRADYFNLCSAHAAFYERIKPDGRARDADNAPSARRSPHFRLKVLTAAAGSGAAGQPAGSHSPAGNYTGLAAIVHRPLILAGHTDEAERDALLAAIRHDVSDRPGDLALVQMALFEMWRESDGGQENLVEAYSRVGGVAGALAHAAEEVRTEKLTEDEAGLLEAVLVRLVTLGETGGATRRAARWEEFDAARRKLAERLTREHYGRLLLAGSDAIEICHEQLITQWPWWQNALSAAATDVRRLARLMQRAAEWSSGGRPRGHLANGAELDFFRQIAKQRPSWLSTTEVAFVTAATWWARFWRSAGVTVLLVAAGVGLWAYNSQRQARQALTTLLQTGDALVVDLGQEFQKRNLPEDLLDRILDRAIDGYNQAIESDPKNVEAYRGRGLAYLGKRDFDRAIRDFDQMIQLDPGSARGYGNRGLSYGQKGDYDRAIRDLDQAIRLDPKIARAHLFRGKVYVIKGDDARAIQDYDEAIRLDPKNAYGYDSRGDAYADKGDYDHAIEDYDQAIRLDPKNAVFYSDRGNAYTNKGDYDRAIQDYVQAIQIDPRNAYGYNGRGNAYTSKGDYDRAIQDFDQAIKLDPQNAYGHRGRGDAYANKRDYDRAIQDYDQAIKLDPKDVYAYNGRGNTYKDKGDYDRAIRDYDRAIQLDPKYAHAYNGRGVAYANKGDYDRAVQDYDQAIQLDPKDVYAYGNRGDAYVNKGDYDRAIRDFDQVIQLDPKDGFAYLSRGVAYFRQGNFNAAATEAQRASELENNAYFMIWRFLARERAGENGADELGVNSARLTDKDWPYPVIELYLGRRSTADVLSAAGPPEEVCGAQFHGGEWHLLRGHRDEAAAALKAAVDICPKGRMEYAGALAEWNRLGSK